MVCEDVAGRGSSWHVRMWQAVARRGRARRDLDGMIYLCLMDVVSDLDRHASFPEILLGHLVAIGKFHRELAKKK